MVLEKKAQASLWLQQRLSCQGGDVAAESLVPQPEESAGAWPPLLPAAARDLMVWSSDSHVMLRERFGIWATHEEEDLSWLQAVRPAAQNLYIQNSTIVGPQLRLPQFIT